MSLILQALKKAKSLGGRKPPAPPPAALASFRFGRPSRAQRMRKLAIFYVLPGLALMAVLAWTVNYWLTRPRATAPAMSGANASPTGRSQQEIPAAQSATEKRAQANPVQAEPIPAPPPAAVVEEPKSMPPAPTPQPTPTASLPAARPPIQKAPVTAPERPVVVAAIERTEPAAPPPPPPAAAPPQTATQPIQLTSSAPDAFRVAVFLHQSGEFQKALDQYNKILETDPMNKQVHNNIGLLYQAMANYPEAVRALNKATLIDPNYDAAYNNLGHVYLTTGQIAQAEAMLNRAVSINPTNTEAFINLGTAAKKANNLEKAKVQYLRALQINPESATAHYNIALIYEEEREFSRAVEHYKKFVKFGGARSPDLAADVERKIEELTRRIGSR